MLEGVDRPRGTRVQHPSCVPPWSSTHPNFLVSLRLESACILLMKARIMLHVFVGFVSLYTCKRGITHFYLFLCVSTWKKKL